MSGPARILVAFGTRPEAIKLFPVVAALRRDPRFITRTCVTGQHRGMLDQVLTLAGIAPDHDLDLMRPGQSLAALTAALLDGVGRVIEVERPDWVVVQGDTASAMAAGLAAHYRRVPVAHVEAGLRSGDIHQPWPEEVHRRIVATFAALHFAPTEAAAAALSGENVAAASVHVTGNTVIDALHWVTARIAEQPALAQGLAPLERRFAGKRIVAVTCHRRENLGEPLAAIAHALRAIAARDEVALIVPLHPNPAARLAMQATLAGSPNVAMIEPLDYAHFARLLGLAEIVLTDSGGVQEEAPALGKPVLVLRETTERGEAVAAGTARLVGTAPERIVAETFALLDDPAAYARMARAHHPFGDGHAAGRIVRILGDTIFA